MNAPIRSKPIHLEGGVGEDFTAATVRAQLDALAGAPVTVHINSPGGSAAEALSIFHEIKSYPGKVTTVDVAIAASGGSLIFQAGDHRVMREGSLLMVHSPSAFGGGNANEHTQLAGTLTKWGAEFAGIYAARSGQPVGRVQQWMNDESWFTGSEAIAAGLADRIENTAAEPFARYDYRVFAHAPSMLLKGAPTMDVAETRSSLELSSETSEITLPVDRAILRHCALAKLSAAETEIVMEAAAGDIEKAKARVIDMIADRDPDGGRIAPPTAMSFDNGQFLAKTIEDALYCRMSGKPALGAASEWVGRPILYMGAALLQAGGERIKSWNRDRLASQIMMASPGHHSTSDFPTIAVAAANRILLDNYKAAESPLKQLARVRTAVDFRAVSTVRLGEMPQLLEVQEGGEIQYGSRVESAESFRLKTYARIFAVTRQLLINDDLGAFSDTLAAFGRASAETEAGLLADLLLANAGLGPTMSDATAMFHANHGNLVTPGTAIDVDTLSEARLLMRQQTGLDGETPVGATPKYLVVGPGNETAAERVVSSTVFANTTAEVNPFASMLVVLTDPRLPDYAWYLFARPEQLETLAVAYLNGVAAPQLSQREGWDVLGTEFRAVLDFGCGVVDYRGAVRNAGAAPS